LRTGGFLATVVAFPKDEAQQYGVGVARVQCTSNPEELGLIRELVDTGKLKAHVATVLPLQDVKRALELSATGRTRGKIVLEVAAG